MVFLKNNRHKLTTLAVIIVFAIIAIDKHFINNKDSLLQWLTLLAGLFICLYLQFYITINDESDFNNATEAYFRRDIEFINNPKTTNMAKKPTDKPEETDFNKTDASPEGTPNDGTETETNDAIGNNDITFGVEEEETDELPISSFSVQGILPRYRQMYQDICTFALHNNEPKTVALLQARMVSFGHPFAIERKGSKLVAFKTGDLRFPLNGYFGVTS